MLNEWAWDKVYDIAQAFASGQAEKAHELIEEVLAEIGTDGARIFYAAFAMSAENTESIRAFEDYMDSQNIDFRPRSDRPRSDEGPENDASDSRESDDSRGTSSDIDEDPTSADSGVEL